MGRHKIFRSKEELLVQQRIRQQRYYKKNKDRLNHAAMLKYWKKDCPKCHKEMVYTTKSNLNKSMRGNFSCRSCSQRLRPFEYLYNSIIYNCRKRDIDFSLTYDDFVEFTKIDKCHYCGQKIEWIDHNHNNGIRGYTYNLDRMNNHLGYIKSNCCVCCAICNGVKSNIFTHSEMIELGKIIHEIKEKRLWTK